MGWLPSLDLADFEPYLTLRFSAFALALRFVPGQFIDSVSRASTLFAFRAVRNPSHPSQHFSVNPDPTGPTPGDPARTSLSNLLRLAKGCTRVNHGLHLIALFGK